MTRIIQNLAEVSNKYEALFCDLWGCVHNGVRPFDQAVAALQKYRENSGVVVLVTNAPRHAGSVEKHLARLGLPNNCWDTIASSGDSARGNVSRRGWAKGLVHGPAPRPEFL